MPDYLGRALREVRNPVPVRPICLEVTLKYIWGYYGVCPGVLWKLTAMLSGPQAAQAHQSFDAIKAAYEAFIQHFNASR